MRALVLLSVVLSGGCAIWRAGEASEVKAPSAEVRDLLVVTDDRAFQLTKVEVDGGRIAGRVARAWDVGAGAGAAVQAEGNAAPDKIAQRLNWLPVQGLEGETIELDRDDVRAVRVYEPRTGRTVAAWVFGGLFAAGGTVATVFGIIVAIIFSSWGG